MKKDDIQNIQGGEHLKYDGLLNLAHERGLKRISTVLVQIPTPENNGVCIMHATVEMEDGTTFDGIGDASPQNVGRMIAPHIIRMAETRAKGRAMRDAVNVGQAIEEEFGEAGSGHGDGAHLLNEPEPYRADVPKASPYKPASANQLATATKLSRLLDRPMPEESESLTSAEASDLITELSREYNERKRGADGRFSDPAPSAEGPAVQVTADGRRVDTETGERLEDNPFDGAPVHNQETDPSPTLTLAKGETEKALTAYMKRLGVNKGAAWRRVLHTVQVPPDSADWTVQHYTSLTIWMNSQAQPKPAQEPEREVMEV